jgi:hypothetical protein
MTNDIGLVESFGFGNDPIVIRNYVAGIIGGKILDVEDYTEEFIRAGHIVIRKDDEYKPLPVKDGKYEALPEGYEYVGVVVATKATKEPFVGIMYSGEVNDVASPYPISTELKAALKVAVPTLVFNHD